MKEANKTTEKVLNHHLQAFGSGNVKEILADYTEESKVFTPDATLSGLKNIKALFENFTSNLLPPGFDFEMIKKEVDGETAYIVWKAKSKSHQFHLGTDTFIVKNGKIITQTFAGHIEEL